MIVDAQILAEPSIIVNAPQGMALAANRTAPSVVEEERRGCVATSAKNDPLA